MPNPSEAQIMREIQIAVSKMGHRVLRNNSGLFELKDGRRMRTGLGVGSSDLVGVLAGSGRILCIEVKRYGGKPTEEQISFITMINRMGGVAFIAHSVEEAIQEIERRTK